MHKRTTPKIFQRATPALAGGAREQLHRNMSPTEEKLWKHLRAHRMGDTHFRNHTCPGGRCQGHAIGNYIVDFCAPRKKLIVELDGSQHLDQAEYDEERTKYLEMNNIETVLQVIWHVLNENVVHIESHRHLEKV